MRRKLKATFVGLVAMVLLGGCAVMIAPFIPIRA